MVPGIAGLQERRNILLAEAAALDRIITALTNAESESVVDDLQSLSSESRRLLFIDAVESL